MEGDYSMPRLAKTAFLAAFQRGNKLSPIYSAVWDISESYWIVQLRNGLVFRLDTEEFNPSGANWGPIDEPTETGDMTQATFSR